MSLGKRSRRTFLASFMLVAFALRTLIPPGFMPASGHPFSVEICWEGLPAGMLAQSEPGGQGEHHHHHEHSGSSSHSEHCVFGSACSAGPLSHLPQLSAISAAQRPRPIACESIAGAIRLVHLPPPRAPPGQLS